MLLVADAEVLEGLSRRRGRGRCVGGTADRSWVVGRGSPEGTAKRRLGGESRVDGVEDGLVDDALFEQGLEFL